MLAFSLPHCLLLSKSPWILDNKATQFLCLYSMNLHFVSEFSFLSYDFYLLIVSVSCWIPSPCYLNIFCHYAGFFFFFSFLHFQWIFLCFFFFFWPFWVFIATCNLVPPSVPHPRLPVNLRFFLHCKVVKNPPANARDTGDVGLILGSGRSPGGGHGNPLKYSCLENSMDRGAWWVTVHVTAKSRTRLSRHT